jgi:hypothetical protein
MHQSRIEYIDGASNVGRAQASTPNERSFPMTIFITLLQGLALVLISLVLGTVFGIWRGYDPLGYSPATFIEVHQGAVRGLNTLIPLLGIATLTTTVLLAIGARERPAVLGVYIAAILAIAVAGLVTRFGNQPINEQVMGWTVGNLPADWTAIRDRWWSFHLIRLAASFVGELLLIGAVLADRA